MKHKYKKQVYLGFDSDGKQIRKWFYGETKAELNQNILRCRMEAEKVKNPSEITFSEFSARWSEVYKSNRSKQTRDMYANALNKCSSIDPVPIKRITRSMCQEIVAESWEHPRTAKIVADTLKQIFKTAIADGIIAANPAENLSLPKKQEHRFHLLTEDELAIVDRAKLSDQDRLFVTILRVFGLRPAEALALQPTDFDWKAKVVRISKAVELTNDNQSRIKTTKTGTVREISVPASLIPSFRKRIRGISSVFLFPKADGGLYTKSAYRKLSDRIHKALNEVVIKDKIEKLKVKTPEKEATIRSIDYFPDFTLYCFRHRRATDLYYLTQTGKISTKKAAYLMGHSEVVFLTTYSHLDESKEGTDIYANASIPSAQNL